MSESPLLDEPLISDVDQSADQDPDADALAYLEDRILKAVSLVKSLRADKETLALERDALLEEKELFSKELADTQAAWEEAQTANQKLSQQLQLLQGERQKVRNRLEGLLGQIDQLGGE